LQSAQAAGHAECKQGEPDCNLCVEQVEETFLTQNTKTSSDIHGRLGKREKQYRNDEVDHNQGIGRLYHPDGRFFVLSRSLERHGQLLIFQLRGYSSTQDELGSSGSHSLENTVVWQYQDAAYGRNHPDGLSVMGNYIVHGISCKGGLCETGSDMPRIYVWDAANPEEPKLVLDFDLVNWLGTPNDTASAGAAALVKISGTQYMLVVKSKESHSTNIPNATIKPTMLSWLMV
jgi:hypothetical protein